MPDQAQLLALAKRNPNNAEILTRITSIGLPEGYLVAGCLFQSVWNGLSNRTPTHGIRDYDVFYYDDSDLSWEAEDAVIQACLTAVADLDITVEVRNQARVHRWYEQKFGSPIAPLASATDGIDHFLNQSSCFGVSLDGQQRVYAPFGYADLFDRIVRPNRVRDLPAVYADKAARWKAWWPELTVLPW